ncbi:MAG TPA: PAS domain S-box protein [Flavobacteriales bacterium]|nr:PAS domain S-box protein [Flavobacteriales bacterium]
MNTHVFDFDFSRTSMVLLFLLPALINTFIGLYVFLFLPKGRTNNLFSFFVFLLVAWQIFDGLMHLSTNVHAAESWYRLTGIAAQFVLPFGVLFSLRFTRWHKSVSDKLIFTLLFLPAILFFMIINLKLDTFDIVKSYTWHWVANPQPTFITSIIYFFLAVEAMLMLIIPLAYFMNDQHEKIRRKQALLLFLGFLAPVCGGLILEIVLPLAGGFDDVPATSSLMTLFAIVALVAIKRYKFLEYSPLHHWENIVESTNEGIMITNNANEIMYVNKAFCRLLEYVPREIKSKNAKKLLLLKEPAETYNMQHESELHTKYGRKIWVLISNSPYLDVRGNKVGTIAIITDITQVKERESSLKQVIDAGRMVTLDVDFLNKSVRSSKNAGEILGIPVLVENIAGVIDACVHPDDKSKVRQAMSNHINGIITDLEFRFIRPDNNKILWLERRCEAVRDANGKITGSRGILIDITQRKMNEEATAALTSTLKEAQAISHVGNYEVNYVNGESTWSDETFKILGYMPGEIQASLLNFINSIHADDREHIQSMIGSAKEKLQGFSFYGRIVRHGGNARHIYCEGRFIVDNKNNLVRLAGIIQDVTRTKVLEETLQASNKELETYIYKASHDLRAPITSILGLTHVSKYEVKQKKALEYIEKIENTAQKLDETIKDLVQSMTIKDTNQFNDKIDFESLINETVSKYELRKEYASIRIRPNLVNKRSFVSNKFIMESLFQNLVENAIKYQKQDCDHSFLNIQVKDSAKGVEVKFEDNGIGMDPDSQARAFDMYYRGTGQASGTGLGLYLVKTGVEKLGGTIHIQSTVDKGTTMTLNLPCLC